jgi:hypothetical protein
MRSALPQRRQHGVASGGCGGSATVGTWSGKDRLPAAQPWAAKKKALPAVTNRWKGFRSRTDRLPVASRTMVMLMGWPVLSSVHPRESIDGLQHVEKSQHFAAPDFSHIFVHLAHRGDPGVPSTIRLWLPPH